MHDGSLATLEGVVAFYVKGGNHNPNLDRIMIPRSLANRDSANLVAFLRTLTSDVLRDSNAVRGRFFRPQKN